MINIFDVCIVLFKYQYCALMNIYFHVFNVSMWSLYIT